MISGGQSRQVPDSSERLPHRAPQRVHQGNRPVSDSINDIPSYKLRWRISEADIVCSNRNHEVGIGFVGPLRYADRQFSSSHLAWCEFLCKNNDLPEQLHSEAFCRSRSRSRHHLGDVACRPTLDSQRLRVWMTAITRNHCPRALHG